MGLGESRVTGRGKCRVTVFTHGACRVTFTSVGLGHRRMPLTAHSQEPVPDNVEMNY